MPYPMGICLQYHGSILLATPEIVPSNRKTDLLYCIDFGKDTATFAIEIGDLGNLPGCRAISFPRFLNIASMGIWDHPPMFKSLWLFDLQKPDVARLLSLPRAACWPQDPQGPQGTPGAPGRGKDIKDIKDFGST